MSDGRKRTLIPFTGCKNRKAWNRTKEKYTPAKRRQNLAETDRRSYYEEERLEEFLDSKGAIYNGNGSDNDNEMRVIMKIMSKTCCRRVLLIVATK